MISENIITSLDLVLSPFYIILIYLVASLIKNRRGAKNPVYKYFLGGLFAKVFGAISLCLIYVYYYKTGGDTLNYNSDSSVMLNLLFHSPKDFFTVWLSPFSKESLSYFSED